MIEYECPECGNRVVAPGPPMCNGQAGEIHPPIEMERWDT